MKDLVKTIRVAPTPTGYANSLLFLLEDGNKEGKQWAREEVRRLIRAAATITPEAWGEE